MLILIWVVMWITNIGLLLFMLHHFKKEIAPLNRMPEILESELTPPKEPYGKGQEAIYQMNWHNNRGMHKFLFVSEYWMFFMALGVFLKILLF